MVNPNEDTEFNDALRASGILPPKPPSRSPSPDIPHFTKSDRTQIIAESANPIQLNELLENEQLDSDDEEIFKKYREQRIQEMKAEEKKGRFGSLMPLGREDFVKEVTEGSKVPLEGEEEDDEKDVFDDEDDVRDKETEKEGKLRGTGVVVFLYKDSIPLSQHLRPLLSRLAPLHPSTKFLAIRADLCIPNYPDKNVPTMLIYRNGDITGNVVAGMGLKGMKTSIQDLEALLFRYRALEKFSPEIRRTNGNDHDENDEDEDDAITQSTGMIGAAKGGIRRGGKNAPKHGGDSDDSGFDM